MTTLKVGIATYDEMKARTMAVARGERRISRDEPKVWFTKPVANAPDDGGVRARSSRAWRARVRHAQGRA